MIKVIGVRFRTAGKVYYFDPLDFDIKKATMLSWKQPEVSSLVRLLAVSSR